MFRKILTRIKSRWRLFQYELISKYYDSLKTRRNWNDPNHRFISYNDRVKKMKWINKQIKKYYRLCEIFCKDRAWRC